MPGACTVFVTRHELSREKMTTAGKFLRLFTLDQFSLRQFNDPSYCGTQIRDFSPVEFLNKLNEIYAEGFLQDHNLLQDGYAPFCKHLFVKNFTTATQATVLLTSDIKHLVESDYEARQSHEVPVLTRWIPRSKYLSYFKLQALPPAKYLDVILYNHAQLKEEAMSQNIPFNQIKTSLSMPSQRIMEDSDDFQSYGVISIKAQDEPYELPMQPITIMRNCLIAQGGSGVPFDQEKYLKSVSYWRKHCLLR